MEISCLITTISKIFIQTEGGKQRKKRNLGRQLQTERKMTKEENRKLQTSVKRNETPAHKDSLEGKLTSQYRNFGRGKLEPKHREITTNKKHFFSRGSKLEERKLKKVEKKSKKEEEQSRRSPAKDEKSSQGKSRKVKESQGNSEERNGKAERQKDRKNEKDIENKRRNLLELAMEISLTSFGSSHTFLLPHLRTLAARRF